MITIDLFHDILRRSLRIAEGFTIKNSGLFLEPCIRLVTSQGLSLEKLFAKRRSHVLVRGITAQGFTDRVLKEQA